MARAPGDACPEAKIEAPAITVGASMFGEASTTGLASVVGLAVSSAAPSNRGPLSGVVWHPSAINTLAVKQDFPREPLRTHIGRGAAGDVSIGWGSHKPAQGQTQDL